jgi:hypothetical protein
MLELAISCLQRSGYDTEQFEQTVAKIKHEEKFTTQKIIEQGEQLKSFIREVVYDCVKEQIPQFMSCDKPHFNRTEAKEFFGISYNCLNHWVKDKKLTPIHVNGRVFFSKEECKSLVSLKTNLKNQTT